MSGPRATSVYRRPISTKMIPLITPHGNPLLTRQTNLQRSSQSRLHGSLLSSQRSIRYSSRTVHVWSFYFGHGTQCTRDRSENTVEGVVLDNQDLEVVQWGKSQSSSQHGNSSDLGNVRRVGKGELLFRSAILSCICGKYSQLEQANPCLPIGLQNSMWLFDSSIAIEE